jgi:hypothetical protein
LAQMPRPPYDECCDNTVFHQLKRWSAGIPFWGSKEWAIFGLECSNIAHLYKFGALFQSRHSSAIRYLCPRCYFYSSNQLLFEF